MLAIEVALETIEAQMEYAQANRLLIISNPQGNDAQFVS